MSSFHRQLKLYRYKTIDPRSDPPKRLTQERLAELMSDTVRVTDREISFWETGRRKIPYGDRVTLLCLLKVLHECGGIQTLGEANELLQLGRYDALLAVEAQGIGPAWEAEQAVTPSVPQPVFPQAVYQPWWRSVYEWCHDFFRWSEADDHARMSWAGMVLWSVGVVNGRLTPTTSLPF